MRTTPAASTAGSASDGVGAGLTALVTGASAGIGRAFARELALRGFDVILTARRRDRLESLAGEIESAYGVHAHVFPADLADRLAPAGLMAQVDSAGLRVDALVNNAGFGIAGAYHAADWRAHEDLLQVNLAAACELAHRCLPQMIAHRRGYIINVASVAGLVPALPSYTLYGSTKSFLVQFSRSLHIELKSSGVHVTALCPGLTRSEFHERAGDPGAPSRFASFLWLDSEVVAREGLNAVLRNQPVYVNGTINKLYAKLGKYVPDPLLMWLFSASYQERRPAGADDV